VESGLYRLPAGLTIPSHHHPYWCQVFVVQGTMEVQAQAEAPHTIAIDDSPLLVICEENRPQPRSASRCLASAA
jgi:hypothetical protein